MRNTMNHFVEQENERENVNKYALFWFFNPTVSSVPVWIQIQSVFMIQERESRSSGSTDRHAGFCLHCT